MIKKIAFISSYLPRKCGIATFTHNLRNAIDKEFTDIECINVVMNDTAEGYDYPPEVKFQIDDKNIESYLKAAEFINNSNVDLVCLQHEYGIYGGTAGSYIMTLLTELKMPILSTLHTVLEKPQFNQLKVLKEVIGVSGQTIVMSKKGQSFLTNNYGIKENQVSFIPHGIPDIPFLEDNTDKGKFDFNGKTILLTFGLMSRGKGIEYIIDALPALLELYPNLIYIVLGATHPQVIKEEGEAYRDSLVELVAKHNMQEHVIFENRFVTEEELFEYINAADIFITSPLNKDQIVSGTLSYALGSGKAIISTHYLYAEEVISKENGILVPFRDSEAITNAIREYLSDPAKLLAIRKKAYEFGRNMIWSQVAKEYMKFLII